MSTAAKDDQRRSEARLLRSTTIETFHDRMRAEGITRAFVVSENGELTLSHPQLLQPIRSFFELSQDFSDHEGIFIGREDGIETLFVAAIHDTRRGLAQGGLRFQQYSTIADLLLDGLRLAQGMTRKNALAGLWWGGGKGIVARSQQLTAPEYSVEGSPERLALFRAYGRFVASLGGIYYTAEDVGTKTSDLNAILAENRFTTCIGSELGGSGNPSPYTARGVLRAMQAGWRFLTGTEQLDGVRVAVQGAGNVGLPLIEALHRTGARLTVTDIDRPSLERLAARLHGVEIVDSDGIFDTDADIFAPCAIGAQVNSRTIPRLKVRLICGAANNILEEPADANRLRQRGIVYVPDFVCNRMGIINCADEWQGYLADDVRIASERIFPDTLRVLKHARSQMLTSAIAAEQLADIASSELNPLIAHRGRRLIDKLMTEHRQQSVPHGKSPSAPVFDHAIEEPSIAVDWGRSARQQSREAKSFVVAAAPLSAASRPDFATVLTPLLADVRIRAINIDPDRGSENREPARLMVGSDPGGLALQLAVERTLPFDREDIGRARFSEHCRDRFTENDRALREELRRVGVDFDPASWLDPLAEAHRQIALQLLTRLDDAGLVSREEHLTYYDPVAQTVLVEPDVVRDHVELRERFEVRFATADGDCIAARTFSPELLGGARAVAVRRTGIYRHLIGEQVAHPLREDTSLPVIGADELGSEAKFLVPSHDRDDHRLMQEQTGDHLPSEDVAIDARGLVRLPGQPPLSTEEARLLVARTLGDKLRVETGHWQVEAFRSRRSATLLHIGPAHNLFVDLSTRIDQLRQLISDQQITFSHSRWRQETLRVLDQLQPWCISRQYWWGQESPGREDEVLSVWFTLVGWSMSAMGQRSESEAAGTPVDEVVASRELLDRWIIPSQLVALAVHGRPAFRHIVIHEPLHIVERRLEAREASSKAMQPSSEAHQHFDEERFVARFVRRPLRRRPGAAIEPRTVIRRFGADPFRLGCLLALNGTELSATLTEAHFRRARRVLRRFDARIGGLLELRDSSRQRLVDGWLLSRSAAWKGATNNHYRSHDFGTAARALCEAIDEFAHFASVCATTGEVHRATLWAALASMATTFQPLCPFMLSFLEKKATGHVPDDLSEAHDWIPELVEHIARARESSESKLTISTPDSHTEHAVRTDLESLEELARCPKGLLQLAESPTPGIVHLIGPCALSTESTKTQLHQHSSADADVVAWYHRSPASRGQSQS